MRLTTILFVLFFGLSDPLQANPDSCPKQTESTIGRGLVLHTALGPNFWLKDIGQKTNAGIGYSFGLGWEFFSWAKIEANWFSAYNDTNTARPPAPSSFTTMAATLNLKLMVPISSFDIFLRSGTGWMRSSPDVLVRINQFDGKWKLALMGSLGFAWHTPRKGISIGAECLYLTDLDFFQMALSPAVFIGKTF